MGSGNPRNRKRQNPVLSENIRTPRTGKVATEIMQGRSPAQRRVKARRKRENAFEDVRLAEPGETPAADYAEDHGTAGKNTRFVSVLDKHTPPGVRDLEKITKSDVELFFEASHAFRTRLATVLPDVADKLAKFMLATPYTVMDIGGRPHQMIPDVDAMTPIQARLAGLVLHRLLPPLLDTDMSGKRGPGQGPSIDARSVNITVRTVGDAPAGKAGDATDQRLRAEGLSPGAARQVSTVKMDLGDIVQRARQMMPNTNTPNDSLIETDPGEDDQTIIITQDEEDDNADR